MKKDHEQVIREFREFNKNLRYKFKDGTASVQSLNSYQEEQVEAFLLEKVEEAYFEGIEAGYQKALNYKNSQSL